MSLIRNDIPAVNVNSLMALHEVAWEVPDDVVGRWLNLANVQASSDTIDIFDIIGEDWFGGISDTFIADRLQASSGRDIKVRINSPGGDVFAGLSIYNLLRDHNAKVTVEVTGLAASSASIIAMAADEIIMAEGSMMMIHNAWGMAVGNTHDMVETSQLLAKIDGQLAGIYAARTGIEEGEIMTMMNAETFMTHGEAVERSFADSVNAEHKVAVHASSKDKNPLKEQRRIERALGHMGVPRSQRSGIVSQILEGTAPRDAGDAKAVRDAGTQSEVITLMNDLKSIFKT